MRIIFLQGIVVHNNVNYLIYTVQNIIFCKNLKTIFKNKFIHNLMNIKLNLINYSQISILRYCLSAPNGSYNRDKT